MDNNKEREEQLYNQIIKMKSGNFEEKTLAFECIGILGNESIDISLSDRLSIVEDKIHEYYQEKNNQ